MSELSLLVEAYEMPEVRCGDNQGAGVFKRRDDDSGRRQEETHGGREEEKQMKTLSERKCDVCGRQLEVVDTDDGDGHFWLACPIYMTGKAKNSDDHTSYRVPISQIAETKED
jgi:hypothetical protein